MAKISLDVYFFMINLYDKCLREKKHSVIGKFRILKTLKGQIQVLPPFDLQKQPIAGVFQNKCS